MRYLGKVNIAIENQKTQRPVYALADIIKDNNGRNFIFDLKSVSEEKKQLILDAINTDESMKHTILDICWMKFGTGDFFHAIDYDCYIKDNKLYGKDSYKKTPKNFAIFYVKDYYPFTYEIVSNNEKELIIKKYSNMIYFRYLLYNNLNKTRFMIGNKIYYGKDFKIKSGLNDGCNSTIIIEKRKN